MRRTMPTRPLGPAETLPASQARGLRHGVHPAGNLGSRQPEHPLGLADAHRSDGVRGPHGDGRDGHDRALGLRIGLGADHGDAAAAVVPARHGEGVPPAGTRGQLGSTVSKEPPLGPVNSVGVAEGPASRAEATPSSAARSSGRDEGRRVTTRGLLTSGFRVMGGLRPRGIRD